MMLPAAKATRVKTGHRPPSKSTAPLKQFADTIILQLTRQQPTTATYATVSLLGVGLVYLLFSALHTSFPPAHSSSDLGPHEVSHLINPTKSGDVAAMGRRYANLPKNRLAIVIPYLAPPAGAPTFPPYFELFATSAAGSAQDVDYLIFHCFIPPNLLPDQGSLPMNVKLIDLNSQKKKSGGDTSEENECDMAKLFTRVTDQRQKNNQMKMPVDKLSSMLSRQIINLPYMLVEYKPAFGHIFAEYLKDYSHWGYSDLDVVFGDMSRWIDHDEWTDYDIVTYGFGDQDKLYLRGQFTFHRNDPSYINQLWRGCKYLSEMDVRYANPSKVKFESAEGCYSQAVITKKDVKVKYAVKAFSDVSEHSPIYAHGMYLSLGSAPSTITSFSMSYNAKSVLYTASTIESGSTLLTLSPNWFEDHSKYSLYSKRDLPLQQYIGEKSQVQTYRTLYNEGDKQASKVKCMYWAPKEYQMDLCTVEGSVGSDEVVFLEGGVLTKQKFVLRENVFPSGVRSFPFFHFQEWKRTYRTTQLLPSHNIRQPPTSSKAMSGLIITKEGALPLFIPDSSPSGWKSHKHLKWSSSKTISSDWVTLDTGATSSQPSHSRFCLSSSPKSNPKGATLCEISAAWPRMESSNSYLEDSAYVNILRSPAAKIKTTVRGKKETSSASWWDDRLIDAKNDVTLALTLQISSSLMTEKAVVKSLLAVADSNIFIWGGRQPSVLLIYIDSSVKDKNLLAATVQLIKDTFASDPADSTAAHLQNSLVAIVDSNEPSVSRKALMNMAANAAPTRWVVTGLELERGLVLSQEASLYAMREAKVYADLRGYVFVIPQFASKRDDTRIVKNNLPEGRHMFSSIGSELLPTIKGKQSMSSRLSEYDCAKCSAKFSLPEDKTVQQETIGSGEELLDDVEGADEGEMDDQAQNRRRRLADASTFSDKSVEEHIENLWWDLSVSEAYGTPGGFNGQSDSSVDAIVKIHDRIEVSLISLLDRSEYHLDYLRYFDKSPVLLIDRLGPSPEMMTLDFAPEVEEFGGRCFNLLRLAQLATLGYRINVLPGAFAASYPKTRSALCTDALAKRHDSSQCDCDLGSEATINEILIDEVKRPAKVAVLKDFDSRETVM
eukprot:CCRYP_009690-RA/>CCRYP_009690-RA protein AED:0.11 eAED:0.11 QI:431/1/1/1/0.5/0.33/3/736/1113